MSQRFFRCSHCGLPHDLTQTICPLTGKAIERRRVPGSGLPADRGSAATSAGRGSKPASHPQPHPPAAPGQVARQGTAPSPRQSHRDLIGKTVGAKYLVRSILGQGGMGAVYEAENIQLGRSVAVKVLHPAQARKKVAVKRFHQEARAAGAIGHPNICEVYDLGTLDDGSPYLVMERLSGETLAERIAREGGLPFEDVIDVLTQVLSGLVAAHEKGIVHRDIKPENIFLTRRVGCPPLAKLLDFGVSKMIAPLPNEADEDLDLTRTGMVMGTPFYMSPEQARGDRNLDARVDLYACGIILYESLTGRRPFTASNYNALLLQILTTSPRPARTLRPALPLGFDEVLQKSIARNREERFQSAAEFQRELQSLRDRHPQTLLGPDVSDMSRQMQPRRQTPPQAVVAAASRPRIEPVPPPRASAPNPPPPPSVRSDLTPSSVEIPILFSDTPLSGEHIPVQVPAQSNEERSAPLSTSSDTDTTERRADLTHLSMGKRARSGPKIPRAMTTERGTAPALEIPDAEGDDTATLIQPTPTQFIGGRRRQPRAAMSADDTIRMEGDTAREISEERDRLSPEGPVPPAGPKVPRP